MSYIKTRGFVLRTVSYGENRRLLEILAQSGKLYTVSAKKSSKMNVINALSQPFVLADWELFEQKNRIYFRGGNLVYAYQEFLKDWDKMSAASHLAQVFCDALRHQAGMPQAYELWAYSSYRIALSEDPLLEVRVAQLRFMADLGFCPQLTYCQSCGAREADYWTFLPETGSVICSRLACQDKHRGYRNIFFSKGLQAALLYVINSPYNDLFKFRLSAKVREEFINFSDVYLREVMEKDYQGLDFTETLEKFASRVFDGAIKDKE